MQYIPLIARVFLSLIFLNAAYNHLTGFAGFAEMIGGRLPLGGLLAAFTVLFQFLGSLSLILGYKVKIGAALLIIFLIPATLIFHNFIGDPSQINPFLKNVGLIGGLLMVIYTGAGAVSLDRQFT
ncbi:MAG: DoxX family protein [Cyanobacteria bacterium J06648_16]